MRNLILLFVAVAACQAQTTQPTAIFDNKINNEGGIGWTGSISILSRSVTPSGVTLAPAGATLRVVNGSLSAQLYPGTYQATYVGTPKVSLWTVPLSGPVTVHAIESNITPLPSPSPTITASQIVGLGLGSIIYGGPTGTVQLAAPSDGVYCTNFTASIPSYYSACGGGGGSVISVFGRTGVVVAGIGDYTAAQVTNAVSTTGSYTNPSWLTLTYAGGRISGVQPTITNYSFVAGLTGYPSAFPPVNSGDWAGTWQTHAPGYFQAALTNYSTISGLTGYPSTFPPTNSGDWAGTWNSHAVAYFQTALTTYSTISGLSGYPSTFAAAAHNLLSATHGDTTASSAVRGGGIFAVGATPSWTQVAHSSATGGYWKWNGTDVVASTGAAAGTGSCTNQVVTATGADASPTCSTVTSGMVDNSIAATGGDINTSNQVTATHLSSALPVNQGGTGATSIPTWNQNTTGTAAGLSATLAIASGGTGSATAAANTVFAGPTTGSAAAPSFQTAPTISAANMTSFPTLNQNTSGTAAGLSATLAVASGGTGTASTLTGLVRGSASAMTATELSGDVTTSGSNVVTVVKVNGTTVPTNSAADQIFTTTANAVAAWETASNCTVAGGVTQYSTSTHTLTCHTFASADLPTANRYRSCVIDNDTQSATALIAGNFSGGCQIPFAATITEVDVWGGTGVTGGSVTTTGTSSVQIQKCTGAAAGTCTALLVNSVPAATNLAAVSGYACAMSSGFGGTCLNGATSSSTVEVSTASSANVTAAGDWVRISAATPDTTQTWYRVAVLYTVN